MPDIIAESIRENSQGCERSKEYSDSLKSIQEKVSNAINLVENDIGMLSAGKDCDTFHSINNKIGSITAEISHFVLTHIDEIPETNAHFINNLNRLLIDQSKIVKRGKEFLEVLREVLLDIQSHLKNIE
jgi:hypothetical protein